MRLRRDVLERHCERSTDDPLLFGVGLAGQYEICRSLGLTDTELATMAAAGSRRT